MTLESCRLWHHATAHLPTLALPFKGPSKLPASLTGTFAFRLFAGLSFCAPFVNYLLTSPFL